MNQETRDITDFSQAQLRGRFTGIMINALAPLELIVQYLEGISGVLIVINREKIISIISLELVINTYA